MGESTENPIGDRGDERLTPKKAYTLTEQKDHLGRHVAEAYGVSEGYVSQQKGDYKEGMEEGRQSVSPSDFEAEELRDAIGDDEPENDPYENECPLCGELIPSPDNAGKHDCPECGETIEWETDEI